MRDMLNSWRFYSLGREDYKKSMEKEFLQNMSSLTYVCRWIGIFSFFFSAYVFIVVFTDLFPEILVRGFYSGVLYFFVGILSILLSLLCKSLFAKYSQMQNYNKKVIYALISLVYMGSMIAAIHISVWSTPFEQGVVFIIFLLSFAPAVTLPPVYNFSFALTTILIYSISSVLLKSEEFWPLDLANLFVAVPISVAYPWYISKNRLKVTLKSIEIEEERNHYLSQSTVDELTQLKNRRDFDNRFERYLSDCRENDSFLCVAIADIDYFKNYNDHYGHLMGDKCLRAVGAALAEPWGNQSVYVARFGGEEFALLWFVEEKDDAVKVAKQLQERVGKLKILHAKSSVSEHLTLSVGVFITQSKKGNTFSQIILDRADKALYKAKKNGRNQVVFDSISHKSTFAQP